MHTCLVSAVMLVLAAASAALAHQDPPGCSATGVAIQIQLFRSDGVTPVVGTVQDCEQLVYKTILSPSPSPGTCAYSGGTFTFTSPNAVVTTVDSSVPCLGGTISPCVSGVNSDASGPSPYTVSPADVVGGNITAHANYSGGVAHDNNPDTPGVSASTPRTTPVVACTVTTTTATTTSSTTTTTLPKSACTSIKITTAAKLALALAKCDAKSVKNGVAVVQLCRDKAFMKFTTKWTAVETKPDCLTSSDVTTIQNAIDACVASVTSALVP